ncbi:MAG: hypothetical protein MI757_17930 [Pirellulales bacterium]|nr:hypothetical protein [Pirellulales bacterium]
MMTRNSYLDEGDCDDEGGDDSEPGKPIRRKAKKYGDTRFEKKRRDTDGIHRRRDKRRR